MGRPVFEGLKVLDVTNNYAGPMAGSMLAVTAQRSGT